MTALVCKKCSRYTGQALWCSYHGKHVQPWGDMCEYGKAKYREQVEDHINELAACSR